MSDSNPLVQRTTGGKTFTAVGGAVGVGSGPVLVYQPGGSAAGNVYTTLATLASAAIAISGPKTIFFDGSITTPIHITTGTWDFGPLCTFQSQSPYQVVIDDGGHFTHFPIAHVDCQMDNQGTTPAASVALGSETTVYLFLRGFSSLQSETAPLYENTDGGTPLTLVVGDVSQVINSGSPAVSSAMMTVVVDDWGSISASAISAATSINAVIASRAASYGLTQAGGGVLTYGGPAEGITMPLYVQVDNVTVSNTVTQTSLIGSGNGEGSMTLLSNLFTHPETLRLRMSGTFFAVATHTIRIRIKKGSTIIVDTGAVAVLNPNNMTMPWNIDIDLTAQDGSVSVVGQGYFRYQDIAGAAPLALLMGTGVTPVVVSSAQELFDITVQWGTMSASDTITTTNATLQILGINAH